jgi:acetyl-CoA acetyltransferase
MMREVVIVSAVRTPIGRLAGALSEVRPDDMAALVIREAVRRAGIDPEIIEEVYMGCANQAGEDNRNVARMATAARGSARSRSRRHRQPPLCQRPQRRESGGSGHRRGRR